MHTARSVIQEYRAILNVSTTFPKAGERNHKVEDFVDLCVAVWEASGGVGEYTGWVLDVLWWATRLTFNSYRVLRHMTRLSYVSGDTSLAKRTLGLYVQVVSKAVQAGVEEGMDTDGEWVDTLVFGVRMVWGGCVGGGGGGGEKEKGREASVELAEGVWNVTMAVKDKNPHTRPTHLHTAHQHFLTALSLNPTSPAIHFHLALSYTRPGPDRDLARAIVHAGRAVEGDPGSVRYWHLLGLVSAKSELWDAAVGALESGSGVGGGGGGGNYANANGVIDGLLSQSQSPPPSPPPPPPPPRMILTPTEPTIPPCSELLRPASDPTPPSRHELFEYALQLRMTQLAVVEYVEGVEGASGRLTEVFQWVAEMRGTGTGGGGERSVRHSIDGGHPEMKLKSPSELALTASHHSHSHSQLGHSENKEKEKEKERPPLPTIDSESLQPPTPIPITVSPATPDATEKEQAQGPLDTDHDKRKG
ncbi:hypothetical protein AAF712_005987 [Marasmius tenuissimus]|uniref:Uncharacterized protein n=1 Tax=Marasmius tenuissimus TaxID=585030 RepID=A0ABR3A039_9AGAR